MQESGKRGGGEDEEEEDGGWNGWGRVRQVLRPLQEDLFFLNISQSGKKPNKGYATFTSVYA